MPLQFLTSQPLTVVNTSHTESELHWENMNSGYFSLVQMSVTSGRGWGLILCLCVHHIINSTPVQLLASGKPDYGCQLSIGFHC
jgi:hypothetical protein